MSALTGPCCSAFTGSRERCHRRRSPPTREPAGHLQRGRPAEAMETLRMRGRSLWQLHLFKRMFLHGIFQNEVSTKTTTNCFRGNFEHHLICSHNPIKPCLMVMYRHLPLISFVSLFYLMKDHKCDHWTVFGLYKNIF